MSITKRFVDLAKSNLNSLLERAAETADPRRKLSTLSDAELEAELERRRHARDGEAAVTAARARVDATEPPPRPAAAAPGAAKPNGAPPPAAGAASDRQAREKAAREREARVKTARETRERETRATQQQQADRARAAQQAQKAPPPRPGAGASGANANANARKPPRGADPMVVQYYARLEVAYGASWEEVKLSYRRLMRRYHPDMHAHSPEKLKAATEVSQALTQAYNELDKLINP